MLIMVRTPRNRASVTREPNLSAHSEARLAKVSVRESGSPTRADSCS